MKTAIFPDTLTQPTGVWSPVVVVNNPGKMAFLSGFVAKDKGGKLVGKDDIRAQTRQVCENLKAAVQAAGGQLGDIVRVDVYILDMAHFRDLHEIRREYFPIDPPASTMVQVTRLVDPACLIEINAIAVIPQ